MPTDIELEEYHQAQAEEQNDTSSSGEEITSHHRSCCQSSVARLPLYSTDAN